MYIHTAILAQDTSCSREGKPNSYKTEFLPKATMKFTIACTLITVASAAHWPHLSVFLAASEKSLEEKVDGVYSHPESVPQVLGGSKPVVKSMADLYYAAQRLGPAPVDKSMAQLFTQTIRSPDPVALKAKKVPTDELLPIGEGAYQSAEAVKQRTTDNLMDCEKGKWNDCFQKDGSDLTDGHSYGHLKKDSLVPIPAVPTSIPTGWLPPFLGAASSTRLGLTAAMVVAGAALLA